jgi:hypothetical protein
VPNGRASGAAAVRDACGYVQDKLADIDGELHEPEPR